MPIVTDRKVFDPDQNSSRVNISNFTCIGHYGQYKII